jgi:hypothetical protein
LCTGKVEQSSIRLPAARRHQAEHRGLASSITWEEDSHAGKDGARAMLAVRKWQNLSQKQTFVGCHTRLLQPNFATKRQNIAVQAANTEEM